MASTSDLTYRFYTSIHVTIGNLSRHAYVIFLRLNPHAANGIDIDMRDIIGNNLNCRIART